MINPSKQRKEHINMSDHLSKKLVQYLPSFHIFPYNPLQIQAQQPVLMLEMFLSLEMSRFTSISSSCISYFLPLSGISPVSTKS